MDAIKLFKQSFTILLILIISGCVTHTTTQTEKEPELQKLDIFDHKDKDGDGIFDTKDFCPNTPKDVDVDDQGCPLDKDGDNVFDYLDKCLATPTSALVGKDGCMLDSDKDTVPNYVDLCPNTPSNVKVDLNGCPLDKDGDLVYDEIDQCADTLSKLLVDKTGCPLDADADLIINYNDLCPNTPSGVKVDSKGCPFDSDEDGYFDYLDACPDKGKEFKLDDTGCPLTETKIISFDLEINFDSAKHIIKQKHHSKIKVLAEYLVKHPTSFALIEGHTDSQSKNTNNLQLSYERAQAVVNYLIKKFNIEETRLEFKGFGATKPIADNETFTGRAKNRRVIATVTEEQIIPIKSGK